MRLWWDLPGWVKNYGVKLFCTLLTLYFLLCSIDSERGFLKYMYLRQEIDSAQKSALQYKRQKNDLEEKVKHLSSSSLDLDLLEERARIVLNLAGKDEFILLDEKDDE